MKKPELRNATRADLIAYYGGERFGPSVKAIVAELDGKLIGIGGVAFQNGLAIAFLDLKDEARRFKVLLYRTARRVVREAQARHRFVFVECDRTQLNAARWLERLGFSEFSGNVFLWRN